MTQDTLSDVITGQRDELRRRLDAQNRWMIKPAAAGMFILGFALILFWLATNDGSTVSLLVMLVGATAIAIAIMLYFLSPSRFLRDDVADAIAVTSFLDVGKIISSLLIEGKGVYMPSSETGMTKVFIPASGTPGEIHATGSVFISQGSKGILLDPPGYGLLSCAKQMGPAFTEEGLESEIQDVMEGGMELARKVTVGREGDRITVSMTDLANAGMCAAVRKESPKLCTQIGCPICSFAACMVADGTRRRVRIESVTVKGKTVNATFELL